MHPTAHMVGSICTAPCCNEPSMHVHLSPGLILMASNMAACLGRRAWGKGEQGS